MGPSTCNLRRLVPCCIPTRFAVCLSQPQCRRSWLLWFPVGADLEDACDVEQVVKSPFECLCSACKVLAPQVRPCLAIRATPVSDDGPLVDRMYVAAV